MEEKSARRSWGNKRGPESRWLDLIKPSGIYLLNAKIMTQSVRIGSRLGRIYCATSDRNGYLVRCAMMQHRSELCGDYLLQRRPGERGQNVGVHRLCEQGRLFSLTILSFPRIAGNRGTLTFDTVSAQPSTSHAFCLVSFRVVRSLSNEGGQSFVSDPGKQICVKSCGHALTGTATCGEPGATGQLERTTRQSVR